MATFKENIRKIARTAEIEAKIKNKEIPVNRGDWEGGRGIAINNPPAVCALHYTTDANTYDIGDIIDGLAGPTIGDQCSRLDTITGLTDFATSVATASFGAIVHLTIQVDGNFD